MISALSPKRGTNEMTNGPEDWNRGLIEAPSKEGHRVIIQANKGRSQQDYRVRRVASRPVSLWPRCLPVITGPNCSLRGIPPLSRGASRRKMPPASLLLSVFSSSHPSFSSLLRFSFFLTFFSIYFALFFLSSLRLSICFDRYWIERLLRRWQWLIESKMVTFRLNQAAVYSRVDCFRITVCGNWVELIRRQGAISGSIGRKSLPQIAIPYSSLSRMENRTYGRIRTGIQFVPSSQLQSQIVRRGIRAFVSPWKYHWLILPSSSSSPSICVTRVQHGSVRQAPTVFIEPQPTWKTNVRIPSI